MIKEKYIVPELEVFKFKTEDIICASVGEDTEDVPGEVVEVEPIEEMD